MKLRFIAIAVAAAAAVSTVVAAQQIVPRKHTIQTVAHAGQELRVQKYASWDRDCQQLPPPQIIVQRQPTHGALSIRPGIATISVLRQGATDCTGHQYQGTTVWYTPAAGFGGPDQFAYDVVMMRSTAHDTVLVDV